MRIRVTLTLALMLSASMVFAQTGRPLDIYVVDVEGGNAVLFVALRRSVLIDTGNGGAAARDAERIAKPRKMRA
jgi:hypothetical protein